MMIAEISEKPAAQVPLTHLKESHLVKLYNCELPGNLTHLLATRGLKWWRHLEEWSPNGRSEVSNQP